MENGTGIFCDGAEACNIESYKFFNCHVYLCGDLR